MTRRKTGRLRRAPARRRASQGRPRRGGRSPFCSRSLLPLRPVDPPAFSCEPPSPSTRPQSRAGIDEHARRVRSSSARSASKSPPRHRLAALFKSPGRHTIAPSCARSGCWRAAFGLVASRALAALVGLLVSSRRARAVLSRSAGWSSRWSAPALLALSGSSARLEKESGGRGRPLGASTGEFYAYSCSRVLAPLFAPARALPAVATCAA